MLNALQHMVAELIHGALHLHPRPTSRHAFVTSVLGSELNGSFQRGRSGPGGWWILDEPEVHLGANLLVPDLAGWRCERMPVFPDAPAFELVPDWVCEVLSLSTRRSDVTEKRDIYGASGVEHLWFVDPQARTLEVFAFDEGAWRLVRAIKEDDEVSLAPFEAVAFSLSDLWLD